MFTHLQTHSHYSLLEWIWKPKEYVAKAKELHMKALAMTDYNGLYGAIEFYKACKDNDIHPLIGVELHCVHDISVPWLGGWNIVLIAENNAGYQALLRLVSHANMEWFDQKPRIDFGLLNKYGKDCICLVWGSRSIIGQLILQNESEEKQQETIKMLQQACWENAVYATLQTHDEAKYPKIGELNKAIKYLAESINLPIVMTNDVHYINVEDQKPFEIALSIRDGKRVYDEDRRTVEIPLHLASEDEVVATMVWNGYEQSFIDSCLETIFTVTQRCQCVIELNQLLFPKYKAPAHIQELYEKNKEGLISE